MGTFVPFHRNKTIDEIIDGNLVLTPQEESVANEIGKETVDFSVRLNEFFHSTYGEEEPARNALAIARATSDDATIWRTIQDSWYNANIDLAISNLAHEYMDGKLSVAEYRKRGSELEKTKKPEQDSGLPSWFYFPVQQLPRMIRAQYTAMLAGLVTAPAGLAIGAGTGAPLGGVGAAPGAVIGLTGGFAAGYAGGMFYENAMITAGTNHWNLINTQDGEGNYLNESYVLTASLAGAAIEGALESAFDTDVIKTGIKSIKNIKKLREAVSSKLTTPSIIQSMVNGLKRQGKNYATEIGTEELQEVSNIIMEESTKALNNALEDTEFDKTTKEAIVNRLVQTAVQTFKTTTGLTVPSNIVHTTVDLTKSSPTTNKEFGDIVNKIDRNIPKITPRIDIDKMGISVSDADKYPQSMKEKKEAIVNDLQKGRVVEFPTYEEAKSFQEKIANHFEKNEIDAKVNVNGTQLSIELLDKPEETVSTEQGEQAETVKTVDNLTSTIISDLKDIENHSFSDYVTMMEKFHQGKLKDGYYESGEGYVYQVEENSIYIVRNIRAKYDYSTKQYIIEQRNVPEDIRGVPIYHGTSSEGAVLENLDIERSGQNFPDIGNRFKAIYFSSIKSDAEEYSTMDGIKKTSQTIEAVISKDAKVISEREFKKKHADEDWSEAQKQYDVIYRTDRAGEFTDIAILNPKVLKPYLQQPIQPETTTDSTKVKQGKPVPAEVLKDYPDLQSPATKWYHGGTKGLDDDLVEGWVTKDLSEAQSYADKVGGVVYEVDNEAVNPAKSTDKDADGRPIGDKAGMIGYIKPVPKGQKGWKARPIEKSGTVKQPTQPDNVSPNLYIGNVTARMKNNIGDAIGIEASEVKDFTEKGWKTKRTKIKMTRDEAIDYLSWAEQDLDDQLANNRLNTDHDIAMASALWGDIKELRKSLGLEQGKMPFKVIRAKQKTVIIYDKSSPLNRNTKQQLVEMAELLDIPTDGTKADILARIQEEVDKQIEPQDKIVDEAQESIKGKVVKTGDIKKIITAKTRPDKMQTVEMTELERLNLVLSKVQAATNTGWKLATKLAAQLKRIKRDIQRRDSLIDKIQSPPAKGSAVEYSKAVKEIQDKIDFKAQDKDKKKKDSLRKALSNNPTLVAELSKEVLENLDKKDVDDLSYGELQEIYREIKRLNKLGELKGELLRKQFVRKIEQVKQAIYNQLKDKKKFNKLVKAGAIERALNLDPGRYFDMLDGMQEKSGEFYNFFYKQSDDATNDKLHNSDVRHNKFFEVLRGVKYSILNLHKKVIIDGVTLSKEQMMMIYIGWNDEKARLAMIYGGLDTKVNGKNTRFYLTEEFREKVIAALSQEEILIAKSIAGDYNEHKDRIRNAKIEAENQDMGFEENYVRMRRLYDAVTQPDKKDKEIVSIDDDLTLEVNQRIWHNTVGVKKGFTLERQDIPAEFQTPIDWRLVTVWMGEVARQEHYIAMAKIVKEWKALMEDNDFKQTISDTFGETSLFAINSFIKSNANPDYNKSYNIVENSSRMLRKLSYASALLFKPLVAAKQLIAYAFYLPHTGAFRWFYSPLDFINDYDNNIRFIDENAPQILHSNFEGEFAEFKRGYSSEWKSIIAKYGEIGGWAITAMDRMVKRIGWLGTYKKVMAETGNHNLAIQRATEATNSTQNAALAKDLPTIYRSSEFLNWFLMFTNQVSKIYGIVTHDTLSAWLNKDYRKFAYTVLGLTLSATAIWSMARGRLPEDEEEFTEAQIEALVGYMPLWGSYLSSGWSGYSSQAPMPAIAVGKMAMGAKDITEGDIEDGLLGISRGVSSFVGVPQAISKPILDYIED